MAQRTATVRQQRLGMELRRLRERQGFVAEDVARRLRWSQSKVSRIETARVRVEIADVLKLVDLYDVDPARIVDIVALAKSALEKGWWEEYVDLPEGYAEFIALEDSARSYFSYEIQVIAGLLQTEEYAGHVVAGWGALTAASPRGRARRLEVRLRRQRLLNGADPLRISVIIDEAVLLRCIGGPEIMHRQLMRLVDLARRPNIDIYVLPLRVPRDFVMEPFTLLDFDDGPGSVAAFPSVVYLESIASTIWREDEVVHTYRLAWEGIRSQACGIEESIELISETANDRWPLAS